MSSLPRPSCCAWPRWRGRWWTIGLPLAGLQAYYGSAQHLREPAAAVPAAAQAVRSAQASLAAAGLACPQVTGAGTGTFEHETASGLWGELQAGSYLFLDRDYADNQATPEAPTFEHALFVKSCTTTTSWCAAASTPAVSKL